MAQPTTAHTHTRDHTHKGPPLQHVTMSSSHGACCEPNGHPASSRCRSDSLPRGTHHPHASIPPPFPIPTRTCAATWTVQQQKTTPRRAAFTSSDDEFSFLSLAQHPYWRRAGRTLHSCNPDHRSRPSLPGVPSSLMDRPGDGCAELPQHKTTNMASGWTCRHRRVHGRTDHPRARISFA